MAINYRINRKYKVIRNFMLFLGIIMISSCGKDDDGVDLTDEIIEEEIEVLDATYDVTYITCQSNGKVDLTVTGGEPPYEFLWSDQTTAEDLEDITVQGIYSVIITDFAGRAKTIGEIEVLKPPFEITIEEEITASEFNESTGSIYVAIDGGVPPYSINWSNGENSDLIEDLLPGEYTITVTDSNGCIATETYTVDNGLRIVDPRDGNEYRVIQNGSQTWMYDPLRYVTDGGSCWKIDDEQFSDEGRYYSWNAYMNNESGSESVPSGVRGICPDGWHIPSPDEWLIFKTFLISETSKSDYDISNYISAPPGAWFGPYEFIPQWMIDGSNTYYAMSREVGILWLRVNINPDPLDYRFSFVSQRAGEYKSLCHCIKD